MVGRPRGGDLPQPRGNDRSHGRYKSYSCNQLAVCLFPPPGSLSYLQDEGGGINDFLAPFQPRAI